MKKRNRKLKRIFQYPKIIDGLTAYLCFFDEIFGRERVRSIKIKDHKIDIRTNSHDLNVAISSLYDEEYDHLNLSDPRVIIDAGANVGTSSIFFARKYPGARIFAVEPETSNFDLLCKNTLNYNNIVPIKAAIWRKNGTRTIQNRLTGHHGYTVSETPNRTQSTGQEVTCITIRSLIEQQGIEFIDLLKMDIEGSEKCVLENSQGWIDCVKVMTVELHDRICMGCTRAFYLATKDWGKFEKHGEKTTAYRS